MSDGRVRPQLKWPNDVQVAGAKLAGILLEMGADGRGGCAWLIVGIGVNIAWSPGDAVPYPTTCLAAEGLAATPRQAAEGACCQLAATARSLGGWRFCRGRAGTGWLARRVSDAPSSCGWARGWFADCCATWTAGGAICLERVPGELARFSAGEVVLGSSHGAYILALPGRRR